MWRVLVICACLVTSSWAAEKEKLTTAQILTLEGESLFKAAYDTVSWRGSEVSQADLLELTERLAAELPKLPKEGVSDFAFRVCFEQAAQVATGGSIDRLAAILAQLDEEQYYKARCCLCSPGR